MDINTIIYAIGILVVTLVLLYVLNTHRDIVREGYNAAKEQVPEWAWRSLLDAMARGVAVGDARLDTLTDSTASPVDDMVHDAARDVLIDIAGDIDEDIRERLLQELEKRTPSTAQAQAGKVTASK
jgi:hypothetical protein